MENQKERSPISEGNLMLRVRRGDTIQVGNSKITIKDASGRVELLISSNPKVDVKLTKRTSENHPLAEK